MTLFVALPQKMRRRRSWVAPILVLLMVGIYLWMQPMDDSIERQMQLKWGMLSGNLSTWAEWDQAIRSGRALRLYTAIFMHLNWSHLIGNVVFLIIFGPPTERILGSLRFALLFIVAGVLSNAITVMALDGTSHFVIGASGAISAVMGAYITLLPRAKLGIFLPLGLYLKVIEAPAIVLVSLWVVMQIAFVFVGTQNSSVAWIGHVAGFLIGVLFALGSRKAIAQMVRREKGY